MIHNIKLAIEGVKSLNMVKKKNSLNAFNLVSHNILGPKKYSFKKSTRKSKITVQELLRTIVATFYTIKQYNDKILQKMIPLGIY